MRKILTGALLILAIVAVAPARAEPDFGSALNDVLESYVLPAHRVFASKAEEFEESAINHCAAPSENSESETKAAFQDVVQAFGGVEMFRFGPAREDHRFERLFYWPDRKGRGLKQVQRVIATEDETATTPERLRQKSVAVQGLAAIEYLLHGKGAEDLSNAGSFRCAYFVAASMALADTAEDLHQAWSMTGGYADFMRDAGPDHAVYRSGAEAVQQLLKAAREQVLIVRDLKLARPLGEDPNAAKPKRAPLWRSDASLAMVLSNIDAVAALVTSDGLRALVDTVDANLARQLTFELAQARQAIVDVHERGLAIEASYADSAAHGRLSYALIPLGSVERVLGERYPAALGLTLGFNSLDGD